MLSEEEPAQLSSVEGGRGGKAHKQDQEDQRCDFCGRELAIATSIPERRKYCSKSCQSRASQGRIKARLAAPPSKRYAAKLKFSNPLYFN
jgi:hypothetical protein